jgi:hypothetical protein
VTQLARPPAIMIAYDDRALLPPPVQLIVDNSFVDIRIDRLGRLWTQTNSGPTGAGICEEHEMVALHKLVGDAGDGHSVFLRVGNGCIELTLIAPDRLGRYSFDIRWNP